MTLDLDPLLQPVSDAQAGGIDIRDTEDYEALADEIEKMSSPTRAGQIDWKKIETVGAQLLATRSKDFMLAAWVAAAWMDRLGVHGLAAGLRLHEQLIDRYWETCFPPLKRLRGRRNAILWWTERAAAWLEGQEIPPLTEDAHQSMLSDAESLDARLAELDPEFPPLRALIQQIRRLDVIDVMSETAPQAAETQEASVPTPAESSSPPTHEEASAPPPVAPSASAAPATPTTAPAAFSAPDAQNLDSTDAVFDALRPALDHIARLASALRALSPLNPLSIDLSRLAARGTLLDLPPAQQGMTALMAPPVAITDAFATIVQNGNADGLVDFCESRLTAFPYWLDLDREAARGFALMGAPGASLRQAVIDHALSFTQRLPDLEQLAFADGTPFADDATRQWLAACRAERQGQGAATSDRHAQAREHAQAALKAGQATQAVQIYQTLIETTWAGRDRFRARLALLEMLPSLPSAAVSYSLSRHLADECLDRRLAEWEPDLARQVWRAILAAVGSLQNGGAAPQHDDTGAAQRQLLQQARHELAGLAPGVSG